VTCQVEHSDGVQICVPNNLVKPMCAPNGLDGTVTLNDRKTMAHCITQPVRRGPSVIPNVDGLLSTTG
jgi:hypothetical protein